MNIILNNNAETFSNESLSIREIINLKNFTFKMLVVKVNNVLVKKENWDSFIVHNGDNVIILHLISGG
jgi:sulfur carrier protein